MTRVMFLVRRLEAGGAERQIIEVAKGLDKSRFDVMIVTFHPGGTLLPEVEGVEGIHVRTLDRRARQGAGFLLRLRRLLREYHPRVVYGNMPVANLLSLVAGRLSGASVVWGLYSSSLPIGAYGFLYSAAFRLEAVLSSLPDAIMVNSESGRRDHMASGYAGRKMVLVPSGVDTERFRPDPSARERVRHELAIAADDRVVGIVARLDPMKDHATFLRAAAMLRRGSEKIRFVCVGTGAEAYADTLRQLACELGLEDRLIWTGLRADLPALYNAMDVCVLSSAYGEGTPNVLLEAMACGVPCVSTDIGDGGLLVRPFTDPVKVGSPESLAAEIERALGLAENGRGAAVRKRIVNGYASTVLVARMEELLSRVCRMPTEAR